MSGEPVTVTIKDTKRRVLKGEFDTSATILEIKEFISRKWDLEVDPQRLLYGGSILKDTQTLSEIKYNPEKPLLLAYKRRGKRRITADKPKETVPKPAPPKEVEEEKSDDDNQVEEEPVVPQVDDGMDEKVVAITEMGFPESEARAALQAAGGNLELAVEFVLNGIPDSIQQLPTIPGTGARPVPPESFEEILRGIPNYRELRNRINGDPQMLEILAQQLISIDPQLATYISQNREEFERLFTREENEDSEGSEEVSAREENETGGNSVRIVVTREEEEQIRRLQAMGFPEQMVLQAWLVCDRDAERALALLYTWAEEDLAAITGSNDNGAQNTEDDEEEE